MTELTKRQCRKQVLDFIQSVRRSTESAPTLREIAAHFGFKSSRAAADHLDALKRKGFVTSDSGKARSLRVTSPLAKLRGRTADIPLYGLTLPATPNSRAGCRRLRHRRCGNHRLQTDAKLVRPARYWRFHDWKTYSRRRFCRDGTRAGAAQRPDRCRTH